MAKMTKTEMAEQVLSEYFPVETRVELPIDGHVFVGASCSKCGAWVQMDLAILQEVGRKIDANPDAADPNDSVFSTHIQWHYNILMGVFR